MSENDGILMGAQEIATFMRISLSKLERIRKSHEDIPIYQDGERGQLCADKKTLATWQCDLYARRSVVA